MNGERYASSSRELEVRRLGVVPYDEALAMQRQLVEERRAGRIPDLLLLLQHPPVITLGVKGDGGRSNVMATDERLAELGVRIHETGRGGDVTYVCVQQPADVDGSERILALGRLYVDQLRRWR
jgi:lipoyl(octanoyl) transferase